MGVGKELFAKREDGTTVDVENVKAVGINDYVSKPSDE